jgi:hypothetical protein
MPSYEDRQNELNAHRDEDRARATEVAYAQLRRRGIDVDGEESSDDLATLLSAVERFEEAVSSIGGDRMVHSLDTDQHDDESLVLPQRRADERLSAYARRVYDAADRLLERDR